MRNSIRLPADVELDTTFINTTDKAIEGTAQFAIESVPSGKFNKVTKITITLPVFGEVITITPKERK